MNYKPTVTAWFIGAYSIKPSGASGYLCFKRTSDKLSQFGQDRAVAYKQRTDGQRVSTGSMSKSQSNEIEQARGGCAFNIWTGLC